MGSRGAPDSGAYSQSSLIFSSTANTDLVTLIAPCHAAGPVFAPVAAAAPVLGGGPFAAARAADPFFSFSGRGGSGGQMTPAAQQQGVKLDVAADSGALPAPAAKVRSRLQKRWDRVARTGSPACWQMGRVLMVEAGG